MGCQTVNSICPARIIQSHRLPGGVGGIFAVQYVIPEIHILNQYTYMKWNFLNRVYESQVLKNVVF